MVFVVDRIASNNGRGDIGTTLLNFSNIVNG